jgi:hypothetical protein
MRTIGMKKMAGAVVVLMGLCGCAQKNVAIEKGAFTPDWESLNAWE